jgi:hypothetical protein
MPIPSEEGAAIVVRSGQLEKRKCEPSKGLICLSLFAPPLLPLSLKSSLGLIGSVSPTGSVSKYCE